ncbi:MAG: PocR ligand-binding domain-containing protein [Desulfotomaculaceae bacterium]
MNYEFSDLVDIQHLQKLMLPFYEVTGMPYAILDVSGNILGRTGWQDICTRFHRVCPQTEYNCKKSDSYISGHLHEEPFIGYRCLNGLMDYATPITPMIPLL